MQTNARNTHPDMEQAVVKDELKAGANVLIMSEARKHKAMMNQNQFSVPHTKVRTRFNFSKFYKNIIK